MTTQNKRSARRPRPPRPTLRLLWSPGAAPGRLFVPTGSHLLGRSPGEGGWTVAGDTRMSRRHLSLDAGQGGLVCTSLGKAASERNGQPLFEAELDDGDLLRLGDSFFLYRADDPEDATAPLLPGMVGIAPATRRLSSTLMLVARTDATVLLVGETGTGKEVAARGLHAASGREGPFVAVNCSAIPETLAESQLFGHVAGAFTGARTDATGFFRAAHGGTLFLDEIGELPPALQPKLLRALEERRVVPVGATRALPFDARVVAATNRDLLDEIVRTRFRADLYARLAELVVELPPLRARREDVLPLLAHATDGALPTLAPELVSALLLHSWPFNAREVMKVATLLRIKSAAGVPLDELALDDRFRTANRLVAAPLVEPSTAPPAAPAARKRKRPGRAELIELLGAHGGVVTEVARTLGRSRRQVYRWLEDLEIDLGTVRREDAT